MAAVNDKFLATFNGTCLGQRIILTLHYQLDAVPAGVTDLQASDALALQLTAGVGGADIIESTYLACLASNYTLDYVRTQKISPVRARYNHLPRGTPGTFPSAAPNTNVALALTTQSPLGGRREHGTKHIGPLGQSTASPSYTNGLMSPGIAPLMGALANQLVQEAIVTPATYIFRPIIYHRNFQPSFSELADVVVEPTVRTMRRRGLGQGI